MPERIRDLRNVLALEALEGVVYLTIVDTGRARGNWQVTVGSPAEGFDAEVFDKVGTETLQQGQAVIETAQDPFEVIWLHNGVPYIVYINDGTETIAAVHMVERTVERISRKRGRG